ncbi:MAG: hypothetical protein KKE00_10325 [Proteobacteria bacterium]|nr:hypothetical protein [Pseudomonadota bacterium]MBU1570897.1 hypothetical protein [Pseudomonadota bacterium]
MPPTCFFEKKSFNRFRNKIKQYPGIALFLDFDGTLVPIQKDPSRCVLSGEMKEELKSLADSNCCYLTILSGRSLPDIKGMVGIRNICYSGNHGLVISGSDMTYVHPGVLSARPLIRRLVCLVMRLQV